MAEPILRAIDAKGETYDDPSEDALYMFTADLGEVGASFRVERLDEPRDGEWAQVTLTDGLYRFESSGHVSHVGSLDTIHELLTLWAFDLSSAREA